MLEQYKDAPIIGVTHPFAEAIVTEEGRKQRENELSEFNPTGNRTSGTDRSGPPEVHLARNAG
jgi:hypothetical protein